MRLVALFTLPFRSRDFLVLAQPFDDKPSHRAVDRLSDLAPLFVPPPPPLSLSLSLSLSLAVKSLTAAASSRSSHASHLNLLLTFPQDSSRPFGDRGSSVYPPPPPLLSSMKQV